MLPGVIQSPELDGPLVRDGARSGVSSSSSSTYLSLNHFSENALISGATKLRKMLLETNELVVCPGVYDGLSARTAIELGFNAMYMVRPLVCNFSAFANPQTGAGTTASRLGQPDLAIAQLHEMRENADMIANLDPFGPPLIADMDTGYGGMSSLYAHLQLLILEARSWQLEP